MGILTLHVNRAYGNTMKIMFPKILRLLLRSFSNLSENYFLMKTPVADLRGGARDAPPSPKISSFSCSFLGKFGKNWSNNRLAHPPLRNPGSATWHFYLEFRTCVLSVGPLTLLFWNFVFVVITCTYWSAEQHICWLKKSVVPKMFPWEVLLIRCKSLFTPNEIWSECEKNQRKKICWHERKFSPELLVGVNWS